jgi:hypothetical protein
MPPGKFLIDPRSKLKILTEENPIAVVDDSPFWRRRIINGDVEQLELEPEPAAPEPKPKKRARRAKKGQ